MKIDWRAIPSQSHGPYLPGSFAVHRAAETGQYVLLAFVPGAGWGGVIGTCKHSNMAGEVEVTELVDDRHVKIVAFSKPDGGDNPQNGGPNRAA